MILLTRGLNVLYKLLKKYFGSARLFFSLLGFLLCSIVILFSFFKGVELTSQHVTLLMGALGQAVAYVAVETMRKSD